ncbi:MAG: hypothetical protein EZS28_032929, partial [Streblomastix strix]
MHLIWGAITLLGTLRNPHLLMSREIDILQQKLQQGPPNPELIQKQIEKDENEVAQEMNGKEINCIGVIDKQFTEAEIVEKLIEKIENMNPPEFPAPAENQENYQTISFTDLLKKIEEQIEKLISKFKNIKNPSDLNQLLIQIPSLSSQTVIAAQCAENQNISKLVSVMMTLTVIVQELQGSEENKQILEVQISKAAQGCQHAWSNLQKLGVNTPEKLKLQNDKHKHPSRSLRVQNVEIVNIPECQLQCGVWLSQAEKAARIAGSRMPSKLQIPILHLTPNIDKGGNENLNINEQNKKPIKTDRSNLFVSQRFGQQIQTIINNKSGLSDEKIGIAIRDTVLEKPPQEDQIDGEEFIPIQANIGQIRQEFVQTNIAEMLKGKKVEDLLLIEYEVVRRAPLGNDNTKKVSEGRVVVPIDGILDRHDLENIENRPEIIELHELSLHIQSLLYAEIARFLKPFDQNKIIPFTLQDTEVSIMVDISSSMTKLSKMKQIGSMVLATGISSILSSFGVQLHLFVFADREAIWKLSDLNYHNPQEDLIRLIDSLREGGRPGSFPLDAAIASHNEWVDRLNNPTREKQGSPNHLTIIISDFISAQVIDRERDWSTENIGRCILISLNTDLNLELLDKKKVPRELYENGLIPKFTPGGNISSFCIDPKELCSGFASPDSNQIFQMIQEIARKIFTKSEFKEQIKQKSSILTTCAPIQDKTMFWANLTHVHEVKKKSNQIEEKTKNDFFVQIKPTLNFALASVKSTVKLILLQEPKNVETDNKWLQRQSANESKTPFVGISRDIATTALTHSFVPNRAAGKEPSPSSGQLWIPGLRRFIQSGYTYPNLFLKKSRRNQKAYSITFVIDNTQRIFSPLNISHTVSTISAIIGSIALIPDGDEIVIDVIAASDGKANLLIHNIQVRLLSDGTLISDILRTADKCAGTESGLGIGIASALQLTSRRSGVGFGRRIIAFTDSIVTNAADVSTLRQAL